MRGHKLVWLLIGSQTTPFEPNLISNINDVCECTKFELQLDALISSNMTQLMIMELAILIIIYTPSSVCKYIDKMDFGQDEKKIESVREINCFDAIATLTMNLYARGKPKNLKAEWLKINSQSCWLAKGTENHLWTQWMKQLWN